MTNTPERAIVLAASQSSNGPKFGTGLCLREVRTCYAIPALAPDAAAAWGNAKLKHRTTDPTGIPRGVPIFWTGGAAKHGHIAISTGNGYCWSTDILRNGYFDHVPVAKIHDAWGMTLVGWTEDLNSIRVWTPPVEKPLPPKESAVLTHVINQINEQRSVDLDDLDALIKAGDQPAAAAAKEFRDAVLAAAGIFRGKVRP